MMEQLYFDFFAKTAMKELSTIEKALRSLDRKVVRRVAQNIRQKSASAMKRNADTTNGTKAFPAMSAMHDELHGKKTGGVLAQPKMIYVEWSGKDTATIDWTRKLQPYAARWQFGGYVPAERTMWAYWANKHVLYTGISFGDRDEWIRLFWARAAKAGIPKEAVSVVPGPPPRPAPQPERNIRKPILAYAERRLREEMEKGLAAL